jgi:hypothetical protein
MRERNNMVRIFIASALITIALGLTFTIAGRADGHLFQASGTLKPDAQAFYPLDLKQGVFTYISVEGNGHSDLDCYLLTQPEPNKAWHILGSDESNKDSCAIGGYINTDKPLKLWVRNNGSQVDSYSVVIDQ